MNQYIFSAFKRYNANTRNADVGDCVKRALSVAYSMDYDAVSAELNSIKRDLRLDAFNLGPVWRKFVNRRGDSFRSFHGGEDGADIVSNFCESHPTGVYLLLVGKERNKYSTHMAAVVDGDLYDSWDSQNWYIHEICKCSNASNAVFELHYNMLIEEITAEIDGYISQLNQKPPEYMRIRIGQQSHIDRYTYEQLIICKLGEVPKFAKWYDNCELAFLLTIKLNPRLSLEENLKNLKKKIKQKIYDWQYNIRKELLDAEASADLELNPYYRGDRVVLMKLPEWVRSRVTYFKENVSSDYLDRFELEIDALPEDPRYNAEDPYDIINSVMFRADTLSELKADLEAYRTRFRRFGYDY